MKHVETPCITLRDGQSNRRDFGGPVAATGSENITSTNLSHFGLCLSFEMKDHRRRPCRLFEDRLAFLRYRNP